MTKRMDLNGWYKLRWKILERDKYTCQYCGQSAPNVMLEVDHRIALADGGTDDEPNLVTSCWACNRGKNGLRQSIILKRNRQNINFDNQASPWRRNQMVELLKTHPNGLTTKQIATNIGVSADNVRMAMHRLKNKAITGKRGNVWYLL